MNKEYSEPVLTYAELNESNQVLVADSRYQRKEIQRKRIIITQLLEALKEREWDKFGSIDRYCSTCKSLKPHGHREDCKIGIAITEAEKEL